MSSYDEHLITQAGGDGEPETVALRAAVRAVRELHKAEYRNVEPWAIGYKWAGHHCALDGQAWPCETIAALEPTP